MGKRKSRMTKLVPKKVLPKLEKLFQCPFCEHHDSVACTFEPMHHIAELTCFSCNETYATTAHHLTDPIDVYYEWFDACVEAHVQTHHQNVSASPPPLKKIKVSS